ncbi:MAG: arginine deiminase family protein, partial [Coriobacteriaceae bacterium]|nr:arginine deiminase family protein [Coriobacteriaceae bacterium]
GLNLLVVPSAELSRGRGGPRCMSMPFEREDIKSFTLQQQRFIQLKC